MTPHQRQQYRNQQQGDEVSPGSAGLIVIQPNTSLADSQSSSTSTSSMSAVSPRPASSTSPACHRRHPSTWSVSIYLHYITDSTSLGSLSISRSIVTFKDYSLNIHLLYFCIRRSWMCTNSSICYQAAAHTLMNLDHRRLTVRRLCC